MQTTLSQPKSSHLKGFSLIHLLLMGAAVVGSIAIGSLAQNIPVKMLAISLVIIFGWFIYALLNGLSWEKNLPLLAMFFVKPLEHSFYLLLLLLIFINIGELLRKPKLSLLLPYPVAFAMLTGFGIYSGIRINNPLGYSYFFSTVIVPILALTLFRSTKIEIGNLKTWMQWIIYVGTVVGGYGIFIAIQNPQERLGSFWFTAMTINGFYTVAFFFAVTMALREKKGWKMWLYALAALIIFFGMIYTYTRMVILAVAFGLFLFMLKLKVMRYLGFGFLLILPLVIPSSMVARIELGFNYDVSLVIRALAWYLSLIQIYKHPFTGMGFSVWATWYPTVIPLRILYAQHSHNLLLNLSQEIGLIGTFAYFSIIWHTIRGYWKSCVKESSDIISYGFFVAMMALLFACLTDIFIQQYSISILFWISMGMMLAFTKQKDTSG